MRFFRMLWCVLAHCWTERGYDGDYSAYHCEDCGGFVVDLWGPKR